MKIQTVLGFCLSGCLMMVGPLAVADNDKDKSNNRSARAMQVQLDKKTGKIMNQADDSDLAAKAAEAETIVDTKGMMPVESEPPQYHADGSVSAKLGTKNMKYLVLTVGENGAKTLSHQKEDDLNLKAIEQDKGEK